MAQSIAVASIMNVTAIMTVRNFIWSCRCSTRAPQSALQKPLPEWQQVARGVDFVGHVIKPWHTVTRKRTVNEAISRIKAASDEDIFTTANSYLGLLGQSNSSHSNRAELAKVALMRGHSVNKDLTKIFRKAA